MNWVGGARSRVKQQHEKKIQKEFFERKRLMKKIKRTRPASPEEGRMNTGISQDLLFLQTLNNVHGRDMRKPKREPPRKPIKVDLDATSRNVRRPERNLELPMSPIGKPSTLTLLDSSTASSFDLSHFKDLPKVSTQRVPHPTVLQAFGPPPRPQVRNEKSHHPALDRYQISMSSAVNVPTMPEAVLPSRKNPAYHARGSSSSTAKGSHYPWGGDRGLTKNSSLGKEKQPVAVLERIRSLNSTWERSYDHETPFNFEPRVAKKPRLQYVPPQSKGSLLEFHQRQGAVGASRHTNGDPKSHAVPNKSLYYDYDEFWKQKASMEPENSEEKASVSRVEAALPTQQASEPTVVGTTSADFGCTRWCSNKATAMSSTCASTSESFLEEPLRRKSTKSKEPPKSTSTVFDESILGPISRHKRKLSRVRSPRDESVCTSKKPQGQGKPKALSTFERMMLSIEQDGPLAAARSPTHGVEAAGGGEKCSKNVRDVTVSGAQHNEWRKFTMEIPLKESTEQAVGKEKEASRRIQQPLVLPASSCNNQGKEEKALNQEDKLKKPLAGLSNFRSKNISVMDELLCLEEEVTSSLESETLAASQGFPLTPAHLLFSEEPIRRVPEARRASRKPLGAGFDQEEEVEVFAEVPLYSLDQGTSKRKSADLGVHVLESGCGTKQTAVQSFPQTENPFCKEVTCECDIWSADTVRLKSRVQDAGMQCTFPPLSNKQASTQTCNTVSLLIESAVQTDVFCGACVPVSDAQVQAGIHSGCGAQTSVADKEVQTASQGWVVSEGSGRTDSGRSTCLHELEAQVARLKEELLTAQSTVVWQSLMLKLHH